MKTSKTLHKVTRLRSLERQIYSGVITLNDAFEEQIKLKKEIHNFNKYTKPKKQKKQKNTKK